MFQLRLFSSITSHREWLKRHVRDPYVKLSRIEGMRSRAAYKLQEIDQKFNLIRTKPGFSIVDCGCAPGGWSAYCSRKLSLWDSENQHNWTIIGIDLLKVEPIQNVHLIQGDFTEKSIKLNIQQLLAGTHCCDLVLSDMSPNHSGHKDIQHYASMTLAQSALEFFIQVGKPKTGSFLCKYFVGEQESTFLEQMRSVFHKVTSIKPAASRKESGERYLLGIGKK